MATVKDAALLAQVSPATVSSAFKCSKRSERRRKKFNYQPLCVARSLCAHGHHHLLGLGHRDFAVVIPFLKTNDPRRERIQVVENALTARGFSVAQVIADAVGLTPVHASRVLSLFRERGIVELSNGLLKVFDLSELVECIGSLN